jgi:hypothetical protein
MTAGAAVFAAAMHVVPVASGMAPVIGGILGIGAGAAVAYGQRAWRIAAAVAAALALFAPTWQALAGASALLGVSVAIGQRGLRGALALAFGTALAMLAIWTAFRVTHAQRTITWPSIAVDLAAASAMGIVGVLAMLPRHLVIASDPVRAAVRALPAALDAEVRSLCTRSVAIWETTRAALGEHDVGVGLVRDGVLKALEVAGKSADVRVGSTDEELGRRMDDLDARIAGATDDEVKAQYQSARAALSDQRRYRDGIRQNRERLVARLHNHVAALEKFQLAAGGLAAVRAANEGQTAVAELAELSHGVAASGEALAEVELA